MFYIFYTVDLDYIYNLKEKNLSFINLFLAMPTGCKKFPGQGLNLSHSSSLSHSGNNAESLTHCTTRELFSFWFSPTQSRNYFKPFSHENQCIYASTQAVGFSLHASTSARLKYPEVNQDENLIDPMEYSLLRNLRNWESVTHIHGDSRNT